MSRQGDAKRAYPEVSARIVEDLFAKDPSGGAYGQWMVSQVSRGDDPEHVIAVVQAFHERKSRLPAHRRDLYGYWDLSSLREVLEGVPATSKRAERKEGYTLLRDYPKVSFYRVDTFKGMKALGSDTKWCLTRKSSYDEHSDRVFVVAINKTKTERGPYSKFGFLSGRPPIKRRGFLVWSDFAELYPMRWGCWDASDVNPTDCSIPHPFIEITDTLAGCAGATNEILAIASEEENYNQVAGLYRQLKEANSARLVSAAKAAAESGLLNPLSFLTHPNAKSAKVCRQIWDLSTEEDRHVLRQEYVTSELARKAALNLPEVYDAYVACHILPFLSEGSGIIRSTLYTRLTKNHYLTKETKRKLLILFSQAILNTKPRGR